MFELTTKNNGEPVSYDQKDDEDRTTEETSGQEIHNALPGRKLW